jgi:hypothetical protein
VLDEVEVATGTKVGRGVDDGGGELVAGTTLECDGRPGTEGAHACACRMEKDAVTNQQS